MILILKTGTIKNLLELRDLESGETKFNKVWLASRDLSEILPGTIEDALLELNLTFGDLTGIIGFRGPGSYTGLRIGITVINAIADQVGIPIIGTSNEDPDSEGWIDEGLLKLKAGDDDKLILPEYGGEANITKPRK